MHGILDDHCNLSPPYLPIHYSLREIEQVPSFEQDLTLHYLPKPRQKLQDREPQGGFAATTLPNQAQYLSFPNIKAYIIESETNPSARGILDGQVAHPKQSVIHLDHAPGG